MTREEEIIRARYAQELLENPLFVEAFQAIGADLQRAWIASPPRDTEGREFIYLAQKALLQLEGAFKEHVMTGKMARMQLMAESRENPNELH